MYIRGPADIARAVNGFQRTIDAPIVRDVSVDWGGLAVDSVYPNAAPDLFASHPLVVHGHFTGQLPKQIELRGTVDGKPVRYPIVVTPMGERSDVLATLWARARVAAYDLKLATSDSEAEQEQARAAILAVGLRHRIVTAYTSLVAVDSAYKVQGPRATVVQPVEQVDGTEIHVTSAITGRMINDSASITKVKMDEMRMVPVGGTSRDFTAVLGLSPTASRDAAGVRLAGTSGAESTTVRLPVGGTSRDFAAVIDQPPTEVQRLARAIEYASPGPRGGSGVEVHARARLRALRGVEGAEGEALRRGLSAGMDRLAMCFEAAPRASYRVRRNVTLRVTFAANGKIYSLRIEGAGTGDPGLQQCLRERIAPPLARAAGKQLTLELRVAMQF